MAVEYDTNEILEQFASRINEITRKFDDELPLADLRIENYITDKKRHLVAKTTPPELTDWVEMYLKLPITVKRSLGMALNTVVRSDILKTVGDVRNISKEDLCQKVGKGIGEKGAKLLKTIFEKGVYKNQI